MIGIRLKLARTACGLSLRDLSAAIDNLVSAQALGTYERNETMPGGKVLFALSEALHTSIEYLLGDPEIVLEDFRFRSSAFSSRRFQAQVEANVLVHLERYFVIEDILHLGSSQWEKPRESPYPVTHELSEAERAADALRSHWGLSNEPIADFGELLEKRGIKVFFMPLDEVDGLAAKASRQKQTPTHVMVINSENWGERQRFTMANELAHVLLAVSPALDSEKVAQRFAAAFLMPATTMWIEAGKRRTSIQIGELRALKKIFGVSIQALTRRCRELGIISAAVSERLFKEFEELGWRSPPYREYDAMVSQQPARFRRLCMRALSEDAISMSKAAELLDVSLREIDNYVVGNLPDLPNRTN